MSTTLILWKAPVVDDPDEAEALLRPYYEHGDDSAFQSSVDIASVSNELIRRFPDADDGPWADHPPEAADRLLLLSIRQGADAVIDAIVEVARDYELVLYDPQGRDVRLPRDPIEAGTIPPPRLIDHFKVVLVGLAAAGVFWLGWIIDVPVLDWLLRITGGFLMAVVVFLLGILMFDPRDRR